MRNMRVVVLTLLLCLVLGYPLSVRADTSAQSIPPVPPQWRIIELTNEYRVSQGLPPLAYNLLLEQSAQAHSAAMANDHFFDHMNPLTGSEPSDRILATGYRASWTGENIFAGPDSPEVVVSGWLNSPGHHENIVRPTFREIGVGYVEVIGEDPQGYSYYWTQNFGARSDYYPLVIANESYYTSTNVVVIYVYGESAGAVEMRFAIGGGSFGDWVTYTPTSQLTLPNTPGDHTIQVEIRTQEGVAYSASDSIILVGDGQAAQATPTTVATTAIPTAMPTEHVPAIDRAPATPTPMRPLTTPDQNLPTGDESGGGQQTRISELAEDKPDLFDRLVCGPLWWIIILVFIILGLLLVLLHYFTAHRWWFWPPFTSVWCKLARIAFLLYLMLVGIPIGLLSRESCKQSGIIVWRVDNQGAGLVLVDDRGATPRDLGNFDTPTCIGCHVYHPDTEYLAFVEGGLSGEVSIWDGEMVRGLGFNASHVSFAPDGQRLVVSRNDTDLWIYDFAADTLRELNGAADSAFIETMPSWSPDGNTIIFARSESEMTGLEDTLSMPMDLYFIAAEGGQAIPLEGAAEPGVFEYYPVHSPDGRWIAFTRHNNQTTYADPAAEIYLMSPTGGNRLRLALNDVTTGNSWPTWSADSRWLGFGSRGLDDRYDVKVTEIEIDGTHGPVYSLAGANIRGVMEQRPMWWSSPAERSQAEWLLAALLWLLPLVPLFLLARLLCKDKTALEDEEIEWQPVPKQTPAEPLYLEPGKGIDPLWTPQPALIIGLGHAGRHVLTQFKKNLLDAGLGELPSNVKLISITAGSQTEKRRQSYRFAGVELSDDELIAWQDTLNEMVRAANTDAALRGWVNMRYLADLGEDALNARQGLSGQRVLGRAALIHNLRRQATQTGVQVWERLVAAAKAARDDFGGLTVILVAPLDDDVASGSFLDIAYLSRRLKSELGLQKDVKIVGHLLTNRAYTRQADTHRQVNTVAALRELARFQLANRAPFRMRYSRDDESSHPLDGVLNDLLFDELFVYDGESYPRRVNTFAPEYGIYPAIADNIAMWLDTGAREAGLETWRNTYTGETKDLQQRQRQLMVGSMGIYQYRLPFIDLLQAITLTFARQVLQMLLMGNSNERPRLDSALATEHLWDGGSRHGQVAIAFLQEKLGGAATLSTAWRYTLNYLTYQEDAPLRKVLRRERRFRRKNDQEAWCEWLNNTVMLVLNGRSQAASDPITQRGGKMGLALDFLKALSNDNQAQGLLPNMARRVQSITGNPNHAAVVGLLQFGTYAEELYAHLMTIAVAIGATYESESLAAYLARRNDEMQRIWKDLQALATREYMLQNADGRLLQEHWYETYLVQHIPDGVSQLYWRVDNGQAHLYLRVPGHDQDYVFDPDNPYMFETSLVALGCYFAEPVRKQENLAQILRAGLLSDEAIARTTTDLLERCNVFLGITEELSPDLKKNLVLSVQGGVGEAHALQQRLEQLQTINALLRMETSDPFSLSLVQTADTVALPAIKSLRDAQDQYNQDETLAELKVAGGLIVPTAIFEAEATALSYERRLSKLQLKRHLLNPVVVTGLAQRTKAEVYLIAAAANQEWQLTNELRFNAPEWQGVLLNQRRRERAIHGILMDGLLAFILQINNASARQIYTRYRRDEELLEILDEWEETGGQVWRDSFGHDLLIEDLITVTRLLILDLLGA